MGFSEIISKLISDYEAQKKQIEREWDDKIQKRKKEIDSQIESIFDTKAKEIERQIEEEHHSRFLNAKLQQKNLVLKKKRQIIDEIFEEAYKQICEMDDEKYFGTLLSLIEKYSENKQQIILLSEKDFSKYKDKLKKKLEEKKLKFKDILSSDKLKNGLILYDDEKKIETNLSFESIMKRKKEKLENHIGKILHVI
ncbi:MAG TPA: V-type ATP synthase subunit E [Exilispira sp.]|nr:V-type ATP synthase subunit E [Exilispira sp.]